MELACLKIGLELSLAIKAYEEFDPSSIFEDFEELAIYQETIDYFRKLEIDNLNDINENIDDLISNGDDKTAEALEIVLEQIKLNISLSADTDELSKLRNRYGISFAPYADDEDFEIEIGDESFAVRCYNYENAKTFSEEHYENMCNWGALIPGAKHHKIIPVVLKTGFIFNAYSNEERIFVRKLDKDSTIKKIRNGDYGITVTDSDGELLYNYYPDAIVQFNDGKIAIIEIKPLYDLADETVLDKWEMLKEFCKNNGYMCFIGNRVFNSYDELKKRSFSPDLLKFVKYHIKKYGEFNYKDLKDFKQKCKLKRRDFRVDLAVICLKNEYNYETNYYDYREFRITK